MISVSVEQPSGQASRRFVRGRTCGLRIRRVMASSSPRDTGPPRIGQRDSADAPLGDGIAQSQIEQLVEARLGPSRQDGAYAGGSIAAVRGAVRRRDSQRTERSPNQTQRRIGGSHGKSANSPSANPRPTWTTVPQERARA